MTQVLPRVSCIFSVHFWNLHVELCFYGNLATDKRCLYDVLRGIKKSMCLYGSMEGELSSLKFFQLSQPLRTVSLLKNPTTGDRLSIGRCLQNISLFYRIGHDAFFLSLLGFVWLLHDIDSVVCNLYSKSFTYGN